MSNQGQELLRNCLIGFVCFVLILGPDIRLEFTGPLVLWFKVRIGFITDLPDMTLAVYR